MNLLRDHLFYKMNLVPRNIVQEWQIARDPRIAKIADCHAPGVANGCVPAGQWHVAKMTPPFEAREIRHQKFPAPDRSIGAVAGAVKGHADDLALQSILRHAAGNVGMMMLHSDPVRQPG